MDNLIDLFHAAVALAPSERAAYLQKVCGADVSLHKTVESLIEYHEQTGNFIDSPAYQAAAQLLTDSENFAAGQMIAHYQILSVLGEGGMGKVYLAEDTKLERKVALKVLPSLTASDPAARQRFLREARAAAGLDHSNICAIYEVGEDDGHSYIAMQYIEGQTLDARMKQGPLSCDDALKIAGQVADALGEAHAHNIIHRDIKPANVMITSRDQVKVLDFGLAKTVDENLETIEERETKILLTQPGVIVGTVPYMSPEQVRAEAVDARSDLFSFGVMLYEMLSRKRAFARETAAETISAILSDEPKELSSPSLEIPGELQRIVRKCLAKDKERRYQTTRDLLIDLRALQNANNGGPLIETVPKHGYRFIAEVRSGDAHVRRRSRDETPSIKESISPRPDSRRKFVVVGALGLIVLAFGFVAYRQLRSDATTERAPIDSIAVMPFENATGDPSLEYLSDGITENIINTLSPLPKLRVSPRSFVFSYKNKQADLPAVGQALNVRAILTGRIAERGEMMVVQTELIDVGRRAQIWGQQYTYKLSEVLTAQNQIARDVVTNLRVKLSEAQEQDLTMSLKQSPEAQKAYLNGLYLYNRASSQTQNAQSYFKDRRPFCEQSIEQFQLAIRLEPKYAQAYADMSRAYRCLANDESPENYTRAREAALASLGIDETIPTAHRVLAWILWQQDWDWAGAEREFKRSIELDPNGSSEARFGYARILSSQGRREEAVREIETAQQLFPAAFIDEALVGYIYKDARQYDRALEKFRSVKQIRPDNTTARYGLAEVLSLKGLHQEAITEAEELLKLTGGRPVARMFLGGIYARAGRAVEAKKILDEYKKQTDPNAVLIAATCLSLGDKEQAFAWLEKAYAERSNDLLTGIRASPVYDKLRDDPRYAALVRRVGLQP
jgi:eukaryotic-like serine/threonine-protein kinase